MVRPWPRQRLGNALVHQRRSYEKDSPHALWRTLQYMYTGDYSDEPSETLDSEGWCFLYPL
jgi:hypothetical protein